MHRSVIMRLIVGIVAGITLSIVVYAMKQPTLDLLFNRDQPGTPTGHEPKMRTWKNGVLQ